MTFEAVEAALDKRGIKQVKIGGFDIDGILRGKYVSREKFASVVKGGLGFCDVIFGWDSADALYDAPSAPPPLGTRESFTGWRTGYPDLQARVDLSTLRYIPWEDHTAAFLLDFVSGSGDGARDLPISPRGVLKSVLERAARMGFAVKAGAE